MPASNHSEASAQCKCTLETLQSRLSNKFDVVKPRELEDLANKYTSAQPPNGNSAMADCCFESLSVKKCGLTVVKYFGKNKRKVEVSSSYTTYKNVLVSEGTGNYTITSSGNIREETTNTHFEKQENGTKDASASTELIFYQKNTLRNLLPSMVFFAVHAKDFFAAKSVKYAGTTPTRWFIFFKILLALTLIGFGMFCGYHIYNTVQYLQNNSKYIVELAFEDSTIIYTALLSANLVLTIITCCIYYNKIELSRNSNEGQKYFYWAKHIIVIFVLQCFAFGIAILSGESDLYSLFHSSSDASASFLQFLSLLLFPALGAVAAYTLIFAIFILIEWKALSAKHIEKLKAKYTENEFNYLNDLYEKLCKTNIFVDASYIERELTSLLGSNMTMRVY